MAEQAEVGVSSSIVFILEPLPVRPFLNLESLNYHELETLQVTCVFYGIIFECKS